MHVVATAGHVDHGKSTLVRALTGMEPDRFAEERRRGMTIDLGYAWTRLPDGAAEDPVLAFVDVPGHERFIGTMLAGLGPAPAVLFVVAADEGWRRQSAEHLAAVDALGLRHGLLVVTRADLADPAAATGQALAELARSTLGAVPTVAVSAATGDGLDALRRALGGLVATLPAADPTAPVRLWVDRSFSIRGAGTVVTGTLGAGTLTVGDELRLGDRTVRVRGLQTLGSDTDRVAAVARVAVNLRGVEVAEVGRGDALLTPDAWWNSDVVDAVLGTAPDELPAELTAHLGTASVPVRLRPLGGRVVRLAFGQDDRRPRLPVRAGDRLVLRDPGRRTVATGATVLDPDPPALTRRGSARARAAALGVADQTAQVLDQIRRRGAVTGAALTVRGYTVPDRLDGVRRVGDWLVSGECWQAWVEGLRSAVAEAAAADPLDPRVPVEAARRRLDVPDAGLLDAVITGAGLTAVDGRVTDPSRTTGLGAAEPGLRALEAALAEAPFVAPEHDQLAGWGLGPRELAAAERLGRVVRLTPELVLLPTGPALAMRTLATLPQPFTASEARRALDTTRRTVIPLLEHLDRRGWTVRVDDQRRRVRGR
ncbi:selenocysteine-specific elongation factor [Friedmanniella endophytica]|uniref:Selenocysteine-specific elongation factor n=1 Tax=Microlunatus kandeliicorticis TaxID=1759536 RepID=A0A7W3INY8_9ACTN|nr:selenocysteine-specific translation elongation factor [Microlunatus kandeliicorticis]MBA8792574.1 selenocysteine-specific elongation factor [Microlunatus kandeliicorticis]